MTQTLLSIDILERPSIDNHLHYLIGLKTKHQKLNYNPSLGVLYMHFFMTNPILLLSMLISLAENLHYY